MNLQRPQKWLVSKQTCLPLKQVSKNPICAGTFPLKTTEMGILSSIAVLSFMSAYTPRMPTPALRTDNTKQNTFETQKMEGNLPLHILRQSPISFGVNTDLPILFAWYENMPQPPVVQVFQKPEKQKARESQWKKIEKKKQINTSKYPGILNLKTVQGHKKEEIHPVILKELLRVTYWRK